ncbi:PadR family transcriptional regulator [Paenibacillus sedimenti]|uniref:PadR family transcriptional regulator n=1 Tax=Paenibacillus sedimenti TaxID=2770274 RepID=A0A926KU28_9BACL|nr:PadR family transcriptional regulator [Paenibacillus sedimenti]MBD0384045.1 PadR family transcriptional regulator [Paenibacillus sedimenti]
MYDLFVLGELMSEDKHGYILQERLQYAVGPTRKISPGTLYPLLSRFVESGWITLQFEEKKEGGRSRKLYGLTEHGRERFQELMVNPVEHNTDTELTFQFQITYFQYVTKDVQLMCLDQYLGYLHNNLKYVNSLSEMIAKKKINEKQLFQVLRMLDHRKHVLLADVGWVTEEIERIKTTKEL